MADSALRFSFVIPVYNAARYLDACLKSIRRQDFPQESVEIIVADGGSTDQTRLIAGRYDCRIIDNKKKLAEFGVQLGMRQVKGGLAVVFAADNELVGNDWLQSVDKIFLSSNGLCALWGRLVSGKEDSLLNRYFELIQSDPLNWFLNNNLAAYKKGGERLGAGCFKFKVMAQRPLVWGANGLVFCAQKIKPIWEREDYLGDNDAFQTMIEKGDNSVVYCDRPFVYHHHVASFSDWVRKWRRNFLLHFLDKQNSRNMNWVLAGNYKTKLFLWIFYAGCPVISLTHGLYLAAKDRNGFWLIHPFASFLQLATYVFLVLGTGEGRAFLKKTFYG